MKNGANSIKTTQQLIVHMFKIKKPHQNSRILNINKIQSKKNIGNNFKHSLISQNINGNKKRTEINQTNNLTSRTKYKTSKNSPEKIFIQKNVSRQKNVIGLNNVHNHNHQNNNNKILINNNNINNISKLRTKNHKHSNTMGEEIIKNKILKIKEKKNMTIISSNNNSISLSNSINHNYSLHYNNSNANSGYFPNKEIYINKIKINKNKEYNNIQNKINPTIRQQPNSYREIKRRSNSNYDLSKNMKNGKYFNNKKKEKYYNLINKYISSSSMSSKQPLRQHQQKPLKNKFNTIEVKRVIDIYKQNINNNIINDNSREGVKISEKATKINTGNFGSYVNINKIKNNNNFKTHKLNAKNNLIFSSTTNSLYKPKKQIPCYNYNMKIINKTSCQSKQNSRKNSSEKSAQNSMNHSSINHIINSSSSYYFVKNCNSPAITLNNHKKNDIYYKKIDFLNNGNINNYNYSNNKVNMINGIYNNKYRFKGVYISNSKEHSKENNINNLADFKKYNVVKIINQLYKHKDNNYINNSNSKNYDKNNINKNFNNYSNLKEKIVNHYSFANIKKNINENNNSNLYSPRETNPKKDNIHHSKKKSEHINSNIINKININRDNFKYLYKNKEISPLVIKNNENINNSELKQNSFSNINNNFINNENNKKIEDNKELSVNSSISEIHKKNLKKEENKCFNNKDNNKELKNIENKKVDKSNKIEKDKDLSCSENDNDSLLEYVNNNIDYNCNNTSNVNNTELSESNDSMMNTLKENSKFTCYNRDMQIISDYIKNYYKKNRKYPSTKLKFYKYGRLLGKGAFGKVNLGLHILTGRLVAIKSINKEKITTDRQRQKIKLETRIMKRLSKSNNIVKIFETYETKKHICIVMEYICAGDLLGYIKKRSQLQEPVAKFIFKQIVLALQYIHENNIIHRDIKLDNILIDLDNNIKICDFGVSKIINKGDIMLEQCGTPAYIAPEILLNKGYEGFGVDIWSAGVVLYAMLSGTVPFKGSNIKELHDAIISGDYPEIKDISKEASHLLKSILEVDPLKRITTENILTHPWLIDVDLMFWKNKNLFTNAEYVLLAKSNVDYRDISNKEDMIENFDIKNLDTADGNINKNVNTKSFILAPFNTSISEDENNMEDRECDTIPIKDKNKSITDFNNPDLKILNGVIKYVSKVKELNRNYELNNNQEIDNGIVINKNDSDEKIKNDNYNNNDFSPNIGSIINSKIISKRLSPKNENEDDTNRNRNINENKYEINEKALDILEKLGYKKSYIKESINKNIFNYATASYRLIVKYCFSE